MLGLKQYLERDYVRRKACRLFIKAARADAARQPSIALLSLCIKLFRTTPSPGLSRHQPFSSLRLSPGCIAKSISKGGRGKGVARGSVVSRRVNSAPHPRHISLQTLITSEYSFRVSLSLRLFPARGKR